MAQLTAYASGYTNQTGSTWATQTNAQGSTAATFATFTSSVSSATGSISYNGFGTWSGIPADSTINSVVVTIKGYVNNTSRCLAPQAQLYIGATAKGTLQTLATHSATSTNVYKSFTVTGITLAELQGNTMLVKFNARKAASTQSGIQYVDYFKIDVNYTPPASGNTNAMFLMF